MSSNQHTAKVDTKRSITLADGFRASGTTCGIKPSGKPDLTLIVADRLCSTAGVFTTNTFCGAPVTISKRHVRSGRARAIVCNSGISNVAMGQQGIDDAVAMCQTTGEVIGCSARDVLVCSTGVIGQPLPMGRIMPGIAAAYDTLGRGPKADLAAATAIMTTDLVPKQAALTTNIAGNDTHIGGIAKGAGMIAPNMATMLCFVTTDAAIEPEALRHALRSAVNAQGSFNRLSIDHDTSTSDTVLVLASGDDNPITLDDHTRLSQFTKALTTVLTNLSMQLIGDGEGVTRVFRVVVRDAASAGDAAKVGRSIVDSPLVKTAVHGGDPNWGRLIMAVGKSGAKVDPGRLSIAIGKPGKAIVVFANGQAAPLPAADAKSLDKAMQADEVTFTIDLGLGDACDTWLGCDLSREYVAINADYTT